MQVRTDFVQKIAATHSETTKKPKAKLAGALRKIRVAAGRRIHCWFCETKEHASFFAKRE
jgi:hypothetical protein